MSVRRRKVRTSLYIGVLVGALRARKQAIALWILKQLENPAFDLDVRFTRLGSLKWFNLLLGIESEYPVFVAYLVDSENRVTVTGLSFGYNPFGDAPQNILGEVAKRRSERTRRRGGSNKDGSKAFYNLEEDFNDAFRVWVLPALPPLMVPHLVRLHFAVQMRGDMTRVFNGGNDLDPSFAQAATRTVLRRPDQFIEDNVMSFYITSTIALSALMAGAGRHPEGLNNVFISYDYDRDSAAGLVGYDAETIAAPTQEEVRAMLARVWARSDANADTVKAMLHGVWASKRAGEDMGLTDERARSLLGAGAATAADQRGEPIVR